MDADDIDEALSVLGLSSIQSSPSAEEVADGSNTASSCVAPAPGATPGNVDKGATNTYDDGPRQHRLSLPTGRRPIGLSQVRSRETDGVSLVCVGVRRGAHALNRACNW